MPIIKDYEALQNLAMRAIHAYLKERDPENNKTSLGIVRAKKMLAYLEYNKELQVPEGIRDVNVLAIVFALLGRRDAGFLGTVFGRSFELASKIAGSLFEGIYSFGPGAEVKDTLTSSVFSHQALHSAKHDRGNQCITSGLSSSPIRLAESQSIYGMFIVELKGVRFLLESAISEDLQEEHHAAFQKMVRSIKKNFENTVAPVKLENLLTQDPNLSEILSAQSDYTVTSHVDSDTDSDISSSVSSRMIR